MNYDVWFRETLAEAARQSEERERIEAAYRRCLWEYKYNNDDAARVDRMFCLLSPEHIPCKVTHNGGNQ